MNTIHQHKIIQQWQYLRDHFLKNESLAALALRLYLIPVFWAGGVNKLFAFKENVEWFGNDDWGLGLPMPALMVSLVIIVEILGAILFALGLFTRLIAIPLIFTMAMAIITAHWDNGWQMVANPKAPFANEQVIESTKKLAVARDILKEHGDYDELIANGKLAIFNDGSELATTYLIMLLALLCIGGGRYVSADYWLEKWAKQQQRPATQSRRLKNFIQPPLGSY